MFLVSHFELRQPSVWPGGLEGLIYNSSKASELGQSTGTQDACVVSAGDLSKLVEHFPAGFISATNNGHDRCLTLSAP